MLRLKTIPHFLEKNRRKIKIWITYNLLCRNSVGKFYSVCRKIATSCIAYFLSRKQLLLSACLSHRNSVCLSVRPSHGWISQKLCKLGSSNLHHLLPVRL